MEDKHTISFNEWEPFGETDNESCEGGCLRGVELEDHDQLVFSYDLPAEMNFFRKPDN